MADPNDYIQRPYSKKIALSAGDSVGSVDFKIPGTFNGTDPNASNGRWLSRGEVWVKNAAHGDYISNLRVVDLDNKMGLGAGAVIVDFFDSADSNSSFEDKIYLFPDVVTQVVPPLGSAFPPFIPSGLYLRAEVTKAAAVPALQTDSIFINVYAFKRRVYAGG